MSTQTGETTVIACKNVVLCTGGPACVYKNSVYPASQFGATGLAIDAGAKLSNMEEWQYGIASTKFRWNLSGTYQQVLPRYVSVDKDGLEREFLYDTLGNESLGLIFLKGYQWPFDTRKIEGSSKIDILVAQEIKKGNRVYLNYKANPKGLENGFEVLPKEAYEYLQKSGALFGTPIERLAKMNAGAIKLYLDHNIDLYSEYLEIAVCAQHCNGGVDVDKNWQSNVNGLYATGEVAGTFGVYRPGGSALNSTQVGSLRVAEHIAKKQVEDGECSILEYSLPNIKYGESNISSLKEELQSQMSQVADFDRSIDGMKGLFNMVSNLCDNFFEKVQIKDKTELVRLFKLYDMVLTQQAILSAMIYSAEKIGTHGSALIDKKDIITFNEQRKTRTITDGKVSKFVHVTELPNPELWFETLLARRSGN
jgi:succinate dehydrogenase/fumarate reductase flavoprotein subunit